MKVEAILTTKRDTVGLATVTGRENTILIPGYFNKNLIKEATDKYFDLFGERDISISYALDDTGSSMLMFRPSDNREVFVCVAGKSDKLEGSDEI